MNKTYPNISQYKATFASCVTIRNTLTTNMNRNRPKGDINLTIICIELIVKTMQSNCGICWRRQLPISIQDELEQPKVRWTWTQALGTRGEVQVYNWQDEHWYIKWLKSGFRSQKWSLLNIKNVTKWNDYYQYLKYDKNLGLG